MAIMMFLQVSSHLTHRIVTRARPSTSDDMRCL